MTNEHKNAVSENVDETAMTELGAEEMQNAAGGGTALDIAEGVGAVAGGVLGAAAVSTAFVPIAVGAAVGAGVVDGVHAAAEGVEAGYDELKKIL